MCRGFTLGLSSFGHCDIGSAQQALIAHTQAVNPQLLVLQHQVLLQKLCGAGVAPKSGAAEMVGPRTTSHGKKMPFFSFWSYIMLSVDRTLVQHSLTGFQGDSPQLYWPRHLHTYNAGRIVVPSNPERLTAHHCPILLCQDQGHKAAILQQTRTQPQPALKGQQIAPNFETEVSFIQQIIFERSGDDCIELGATSSVRLNKMSLG